MLMLPGATFLPDLIRQPATVVILTTVVIGWIVPLLWGLSEAISRRH